MIKRVRNFLIVTGITASSIIPSYGASAEDYYQSIEIIEENKYIEKLKTNIKVEEFLYFFNANMPSTMVGELKTIKKKNKSYKKIIIESYVNLPNINKHDLIMEDHGSEGPIIVILPGSGGISILERMVAKYFDKNGFHPIIIEPSKNYRRNVIKGLNEISLEKEISNFTKEIDIGYQQTILDYMQEISYIKQEYPNKTIGAMGFSLGGIGLLSLAGMDERIKSCIPALAGGNLHHILSFTKEPGIKKHRKKFLNKIGKDQKWLEKKLEGKIIFDPMNVAHRIDSKTTYLMLAGNDTIVPYEDGMAIAKKIYSPEKNKIINKNFNKNLEDKITEKDFENQMKVINGFNHIPSFLSWWGVRKHMLNFFDEHLKN